MWMDFQGKKATHDFLSLYNKDSSFQHQESRPPPSQGFNYLKTHDFLKPLEDSGEEVAHVLPGGIGTYSVSHVSGRGAAPVKPEGGPPRAPPPPPPTSAAPVAVERKPEPVSGSGGGCGSYAGVAFTLWEASAAKDTASRGGGGQWPSPFAARNTTATSFGSHSSSRNHSGQTKRGLMESASRSGRGFDDDDDDDEEFGRREGSSQKELTVKVDGKSGDQRATTPRSKHSATEQRRRSKINDRFQILRDLIPHSDQKRDKASFLLEVIEYIQFLQEKVQKYETSYPEWNEENAKLMPWVKVYFRSFWKNARANGQGTGDGIADPSHVMKNGSAPPGFIYSGKFDDSSISIAPAMLSTDQNPTECDMNTDISYKVTESPAGFANKIAATPIPLQPNLYASVGREAGTAQPQQRLIPDADNMTTQSQSQWLRSSVAADCTVSSDMLSEQEELTIDEGTISVSTAYSRGLLTTLTQALESSGVDLSQANVNVQINLGKRAPSRRPTATTTMSSAKDQDDPSPGNRGAIGHSRVGSSGEESEQAPKRHRSDYS